MHMGIMDKSPWVMGRSTSAKSLYRGAAILILLNHVHCLDIKLAMRREEMVLFFDAG